uniref:Uncharacterized protein n=1 Tax=Molossus molossus TaxID=27622 RepID=A0A7J8JX82_MOLMO|nr:hypothetical protein HJG59_008100 [Molossus molossus]
MFLCATIHFVTRFGSETSPALNLASEVDVVPSEYVPSKMLVQKGVSAACHPSHPAQGKEPPPGQAAARTLPGSSGRRCENPEGPWATLVFHSVGSSSPCPHLHPPCGFSQFELSRLNTLIFKPEESRTPRFGLRVRGFQEALLAWIDNVLIKMPSVWNVCFKKADD